MAQLTLALALLAVTMTMTMTMTIGKATPLVKEGGAVVESTLLFQARDVEFERSWSEFKGNYGKQYESDTMEARRMSIFQSNLEIIDAHNKLYARGEKSYTLGVNQFADLELGEFVAAMTGFRAMDKPTSRGATYRSPANEYVTLTLADSVDWRTKGYVTDVKDQGQCGSCWAFSTTGSLEGQHFKSTGKLVSLSEQNLLDCSTKYGNWGCQGGLMDNAFQYIIDNKGIDTEASYPYEAADGQPCKYSASTVGATMTSFTDVTSGDESALQEAVASVGPISVAIDASQHSFQLYSSGLYDEPDCSPTSLDHAVLAVGYGTTGGQDSWIVKNSWNVTWGDQGYIYMSRNKNNQCGIATSASYPVV